MTMISFRDLYVEQLRDLYDSEHQLIKTLPKMAHASTSNELRQGFEHHLQQTKEHAERLENIFARLGEKAKGQKCKGMDGIVKEGSKFFDDNIPESVRDAALIAAAQRVEHYEIAGYGTARSFANLLGDHESGELLQKTLQEEKETDAKLNKLAESINLEAEQSTVGEEGEETAKSRTTTRRKSAA